jgi:hypothetical protein
VGGTRRSGAGRSCVAARTWLSFVRRT